MSWKYFIARDWHAALGEAILIGAWPSCAQGVKPGDSPTVSATNAGVNALKGNWVRPDGGYMIAIKSIGADGQLEAMYFNPNPLPFARAQAVQKGTALRVSLELRAGGYGGRPTNSPTIPPLIASRVSTIRPWRSRATNLLRPQVGTKQAEDRLQAMRKETGQALANYLQHECPHTSNRVSLYLL